MKTRALEYARTFNPTKILIEDAGNGTVLVQDLKTNGCTIIAVRPERNKKIRMQLQAAKFEAGLIIFPKRAPWLSEYESEIFGFPNVRFDDQVDSTSQALTVDPSGYDIATMADGTGRLLDGLSRWW